MLNLASMRVTRIVKINHFTDEGVEFDLEIVAPGIKAAESRVNAAES